MEKHNSEEKPQNIFFFVHNFRKEQESFHNIKRSSPEKALSIAQKAQGDKVIDMINNL